MSAIIPAAFTPTPLPKPDQQLGFVQGGSNVGPKTQGNDLQLTAQAASLLATIRDYVNGMSRLIPCSASGTNLLTLTPNDAAPKIEGYIDYDTYVFTAAATSTGLVTAFVQLPNGPLKTIKVFKTNGSAQATTGDVTINLVYMAIFADHLDSNAGGFVLK